MLKDKFGREHDYLRISLTDKCNLRCFYCMPAQPDFMPNDRLMSASELLGIAEVFVKQTGVNKIRLTGGEPLARGDCPQIMRGLADMGVTLALTTNGVLLDRYFDLFEEIGLKKINISLDSLSQEKFKKITRRDYFPKVMANINEAIKRGMDVKLNMVVVRGENEDEIPGFIKLTKDLPIAVRFIEFMPFHTNGWEWDKVFPMSEMLNIAADIGDFVPAPEGQHSTSKNYRISGFKGSFGFISSITSPFCQGCNRLRLTADGNLRNCLFSADELNLLKAWRNEEDILPLIQKAVAVKKKERGGLPQFENQEAVLEKLSTREMVKIGG